MHSFTCWLTGREQIFVYKLYTFFVGYNALVLPLQHFNFISNQIVLITMKRMLNRMLRYADAIVKRGVDRLIDAIGQSPEPQTENAETPCSKNAWATTSTAHRKQLAMLRTAV